MADCSVTDILQCIQILLMKDELNKDADETIETITDSCDISSEVRCTCHQAQNFNLNSVIKKNVQAFLSYIEKHDMKDLIRNQDCRVDILTDCCCYDDVNKLFKPISCHTDALWEFIDICLKTLLTLVETLSRQNSTERTQNNEIHTPNILGIKDQEAICSLVDLILSFGLFPNLLPGVGRPIKQDTNFQRNQPKSRIQPRKLFIIVNVLQTMLKSNTLHSLILSRNINDIIASLIQLRYCPTKEGNVPSYCCCVHDKKFKGCISCSSLCKHEKKLCEMELDYVLNRTYQPLIIKELLILQRCSIMCKHAGNKWFPKVIGHKLSKCMMQDNGVKHVIEGILAGCNADLMNWKKYHGVGKLIAHVPSQVAKVDVYYKLTSPQILRFLDMKDSSNLSLLGLSSYSTQYVMVAIACIQEMLDLHHEAAYEHVFKPLLCPLQSSFSSDGVIDVTSSQVLTCISSIKLICSVQVNLSEKLLTILYKIIHPLFVLFCINQNQSLQKVLCSQLTYLLNNIESNRCVRWLNVFIFDKQNESDEDIELNIVDQAAKFIVASSKPVIVGENKDTLSINDISTDEKVSAIMILLKDKKLENIRGEFFVGLLKKLSYSLQPKTNMASKTSPSSEHSQELKGIDYKILDIQVKIQLVSVISALLDTFEYTILQNTPQIVEFINGILELPWQQCEQGGWEGVRLDSMDGFHDETVDIVLMLISFLLKTDKLTSDDFTILNTLVPSLKKVSMQHPKESSRSLANDLNVYIATRGAVTPQQSSSNKPTDPRKLDLSSKEAYDEAMKDLTDPLLPTRGHALFQLSKLLKYRNKYAVKEHKKLFDIFETNLAHNDTYLYLAAIEGLLFLVDVHHKDVLPLLCRKFAQFSNGTEEVKLSSEFRMKVGEAIVKSCRLCGDMLPYYSQLLLSALLTGVKDEDDLVRASSLSAIGDVCQLLKFSIGSVSSEIVSCIHHIVTADQSPDVRRAAIQVFVLMFKGIGERLLQDVPHAVRDIHRILKQVIVNDVDELTKLHASNALDLLDDTVVKTLFPKPVLEKKIQILG